MKRSAKGAFERLRERQLASDRRAGTFARNKVVRRRIEFVRHAWWVVVGPLLVALAVSPLVLLLPTWMREFALGLVLASAIWGSILLIVSMSGTVPVAMGALAEQWTAQELRKLRKVGWRTVNGVVLRKKGDVDHCLIGPGGVVVLETKYSAEGWGESAFTKETVKRAVEQVKKNKRDVAGILRPGVQSEFVRSAVVLWGPAREFESHLEPGGVAVLRGPGLRDFVLSLAQDSLDDRAAVDAWRKIKDHIERREKYERDLAGSPPRGITSWFELVACVILLGALGLLAETAILRATGAEWFLLVGFGFGVVGWVAGRLHVDRLWRVTWIVATQSLIALLALVYLATGLSHLFG